MEAIALKASVSSLHSYFEHTNMRCEDIRFFLLKGKNETTFYLTGNIWALKVCIGSF